MTTEVTQPIKRSNTWIFPSLLTSGLMVFSFVLGMVIIGIVALLIILRLAAAFFAMGFLTIAVAGANATTNALYSGDSATRLTVLTQFKQTFDAQPQQSFDQATVDWILPALKQCQSDADPNVVSLADELIEYVNVHSAPSDRASSNESSQ